MLLKTRSNFGWLSRIYQFSTMNFDSKKDYYKILGVQKTASQSQIKSAYFKLAKLFHPDVNKGYETKFKQINEAYSVLSDSKIKKQYQESRRSGSEGFQNNQGYYHQNYDSGFNPRGGYDYENPYQNKQFRRPSFRSPFSQSGPWQANRQQQFYTNSQKQFENLRRQFEQGQRQSYWQRQRKFRQQQQKFDSEMQKQFTNINKSIKRYFLFGIFLAIALVILRKNDYQRNLQYYKQQQQSLNPEYEIIYINGQPFMQRAGAGDYQYNYGQAVARKGFNMPGPQSSRYV